MISSFEKYIKAAIDAKKYSVVCEMANVVHSDKNHINIMTYPGRDVRVYKNRDDEVQILCPKNISYVQESNLSKAISTGTIFDDADEVDKYAGFIVKTKMPIDAMTNKGLENPYKLREVVGSTIGVMNEDGEVDVSDADVDNGNNIIDDLLEKDSKEFKDVKNVVDDYLDNEDHEFGYDTDFTYDIQKLREEIQNFKDADISPEDSITDADWDDNWGSSSSIMGDYEDDTPDKDEDDIEVSDDDSESEDPELTFEEYSIMMESGDMFIQEGAITTLKKISYNPLTKTFITDIPSKEGKPGEKIKCKVKFGGPIAALNGPCFSDGNPPTIHIPIKDLLGDTDKLISSIKHEEGHLYVTLDRDHFNEDFANAKRLVDKHKGKLTEHGLSREEYVADLHSANTAGAENMIKVLKGLGFENRRRCAKLKRQINPKVIKKYFNRIKYRATHMPKTEDGQFIHKLKIETIKDLDALYNDMKKWGRDPVKDLAERIIDDYNTSKLEKILMMDDNYRNRDYAGEANGKDNAHRLGLNVPGLTASIKRLSDQAEVFEKINNECLSQLAKLRDDISENKQRWNEFFGRMDNAIKDPEKLSSMKNRFKQQQQDELNQLKVRKEQILANRREAIIEATPIVTKLNALEKKILENIKAVHAGIDELVKSFDYTIKARIYFIRKYANKPKTESATYRLRDPFFTESYKDTEIGYKFKEECGAGCINANPSAGGNVNVAMEETEPVVPGDPNTVPKPVMSSGSDIQESDSPIETPSVTPPPMNNTADEPANGKKMKPENPDDLNSSPDTADTHAPVMSAVKMESFQEGFGLLRPKKLKAIDIRSIVSYVTVEMNAIKDSNDQAMLSGYVCSKLELIDFYITVLDTHDDRYVVPHSRQYLVDGQKQLSDLLTQILKIRPINRGDRVWKAIL